MDTIARIQERAGRSAWWSDTWAWRGAIAAAPLGALVAILHALVVLRAAPAEALVAYVVGGLTAAGVGCLLAGPLGAAGLALRDRRRPPTPPVRGDLEAVEEAAYVEHEQRTYAVAV